ncbi:AzlC family ABC transporter permease [Methylovirgula sp. 4M-Z18]|uniref:AzlC family ABC transporter permease n=1 Tax=Methylovirgula sp. 4M-Z18 TaxID=2293567 RepID=UPI001FE0B250|nr:AzlC family ABC transporter permease [Methylovirgula sp. 4M-Z18]
MTTQDSTLSQMTAGVRDIAPALVAAVPIGFLYGALATLKGLSPVEVMLTSSLVYAGGAQFSALELWKQPAPVLLLTFSVLLINLRHVLMGMSLVRKMQLFPQRLRALGFFFMVDETWAFSERRAAGAVLRPSYYFGMGLVFWLNWVLCSTLGALGGSLLGDPKRIGADFAFTALFIGLIAGFWKGRATAIPVVGAAVASAALYVLCGPPWHIAGGACVGIVAAYLTAPEESA